MKNCIKLLAVLLICCRFPLYGQQHEIVFQQCYGGSLLDIAVDIINTKTGFVALATTGSQDGDVPPHYPQSVSFWLFEADETGNILWGHTYGGSGIDEAVKLLHTNDNGYLLFGYTSSIDGDVSGNHGMFDVWIVKTDSLGLMEWQRCYGGSQTEYAHSIIQTSDGGYIFTASAWSTDGDVGGGSPGFDAWVVKLNETGDIEWSRVFGGIFRDMGGSIIETSDGGYMLTAQAYSPSVCPGVVPGENSDTWLLKLDATGEVEWQQCYGGSHEEYAGSIVQTPDGGYAFATPTRSNDGDVSGCMGIPGDPQSSSLWFVKIDDTGTIEWQRCLGGYGRDGGGIAGLTEDGNYLVAGTTTHSSGDVNCSNIVPGKSNIWVFELSIEGDILWQSCFGSIDDDYLGSLHHYSQSNFLFVARTRSATQDVDCTLQGNYDIWVVDFKHIGVGLTEESTQKSNIFISPNPATTQAWLQLPENTPLAQAKIELYSPTGRLLHKAQPTSQFHKIDVAHLPKGLYLLRVWDGEAWKTNKLLLE